MWSNEIIHFWTAVVDESKPWFFFQASSFQLLKLENLLRWSFFTFNIFTNNVTCLSVNGPIVNNLSDYLPIVSISRGNFDYDTFYAIIGQNLTGEFMRKIYEASWNLFSLTAKADRVVGQLVMFLTVFLHWICSMKFSCYQQSSGIHD